MSKIKVLIVDDSALIRMAFKGLLSKNDGIEVVDTATDPIDAKEKINLHKPDVLTLDIEMPKMDGISFLKKLMRENPIPVVMISSLTQKGADITLQALELGAVDYMTKNTSRSFDSDVFKKELVKKVKAASKANVSAIKIARRMSPSVNRSVKKDVVSSKEYNEVAPAPISEKIDVIAIGSSTGGVETFSYLLGNLPTNLPPIIITQHMPIPYTTHFAQRLNGIYPHTVLEAQTSQILQNGHVYIANGDNHMTIKKRQGQLRISNNDSPPVSSHRPSVDVMFQSVAEACGKRAIGVIMTGMGQDGASGILHMKEAGCHTIGQDADSCIVYGMSRVAKNIGGITEEIHLNKIAKAIIKQL